MAALTVSMDRLGTRYAAAVETNGCRVEMVSTWNIDTMLEPLFKEWMSVVNGGKFPHHVMYFRDGVSEAQYQHVLQLEVRDLKHLWESIDTTPDKANFKKVRALSLAQHIKMTYARRRTLSLTYAIDQVHGGCRVEASPHSFLP
jgi:hypothetical protein